MIGSLNGKVSGLTPESIIIDVSGVGYELTVTAGVMNRISGIGAPLALSVYTDVKENSISLYGFDHPAEKGVFLMLRKVKGIGSKTAIAVLSSIGPDGVLRSIGSGDLEALQAIPGIGKKTAARLIVELREQVIDLVDSSPETISGAGSGGTSRRSINGRRSQLQTGSGGLAGSIVREDRTVPGDVILALEKLGFSRDRARHAVETSLDSAGDADLAQPGELLKQALLHI